MLETNNHTRTDIPLQMKSTEVDPGLFTDSYCKVCSAQLISESQRVAHYEVSNTHTHILTKHKHLLIAVNLIRCQ